MEDLTTGEVHLWAAAPEAWNQPEAEAEVLAVLSPEERSRWACRRSPEDRRLFAVSHWLVRQALSHYDGRPAAAWRFAVNDHGKPRIDPAAGSPPFAFSLAHTRGLALCAVTQGAELGVDVERSDRGVDAAKLIHRFFAPSEKKDLAALPPAALQERFILYWTLKEATLKALGTGLTLPLERMAFQWTAGTPAEVWLRETPPESQAWRWAALALAPPDVAALALRGGPGPAPRLRGYRALPASGREPLPCLPLALTGLHYDG